MSGVRRGARSVLKWFSALYVLLIIVQVFLAGAGIFGINVIKNSDDCDKKGAAVVKAIEALKLGGLEIKKGPLNFTQPAGGFGPPTSIGRGLIERASVSLNALGHHGERTPRPGTRDDLNVEGA